MLRYYFVPTLQDNMPSLLYSNSKALNRQREINKKVTRAAKKKFSQSGVSSNAETASGAKIFDDLETMFQRLLNTLLEMTNIPLISKQDSKHKFAGTQYATNLLIQTMNQLQGINRYVSSLNILSQTTPLQQQTLQQLFRQIETTYQSVKLIIEDNFYTNTRLGTVSGSFPQYFATIEEILSRLSILFSTTSQFEGSELLAPQPLSSFPFEYRPLGMRDLAQPSPPSTPPRHDSPPRSTPKSRQKEGLNITPAQFRRFAETTPENVTMRRKKKGNDDLNFEGIL